MQVLKIKNFLMSSDGGNVGAIAPTLQDYLFNLELSGKKSWNRTKFVNSVLIPAAKQVSETRKEILEKNTKKDKEGKLIFVDRKTKKESTDAGDGKEYAIKDFKVFEKEMVEFLNSEHLIDITPANSQLIADIRQAIEEDKNNYKGVDAARYAEYCEALEPREAEIKK